MKIMSDLKKTTMELSISEVFLLKEALELALLELSDSPMEGEDDESAFNRSLGEFTSDIYDCTNDILQKVAEVLD